MLPAMSTLRPLAQGSTRIDEYQELRAQGVNRAEIRAALQLGRIERARRDVYVRQPASEPLMRALRVGGRLACGSAAAELGLWVPRDGRVHVHVWDGSTRLRDPLDPARRLTSRGGLVLHWRDLDATDGTRCSTSAASAVRCIARCFGTEDAIRVADSALQRRLATRGDMRVALAGCAWLDAPAINAVNALCGSGYETDAKLLLLEAGLLFEQQVAIPGVGRVDFVVCGCVIVEIDGRETHERTFEEDRARDAAGLLLGYITVRLSASWLAANRREFIPAVHAALRLHPHG